MMITRLVSFVFFCIVGFSCAAQFAYQDSILYLSLQSRESKPIMGAKIWINGVELAPCEACPYYASNDGVYRSVRKMDMKFNLPRQKMHVRIEHPDYQLLNDSIFSNGRIPLLRPNEMYIYNINKFGVGEHINLLQIVQGKESLEELKKIASKYNCTYMRSYNACPHLKEMGVDLAGYGPILHVFSYEREEDRMKLAQRVDQCFPMVNGDEKTGIGLGLRGNINFTIYISESEKELVTAALKEFERKGIVKNWQFQTSYAMLFIYLEPGQERCGNEVIETLMKLSRNLVNPYQELVLFDCPG
ncbi:MAG: hypothetical protein ACOYLH_12420 [Flavobacteriales bacterium]